MVPDEIKEQLAALLQQLARSPRDERLWEALHALVRSFVWAIAYRSVSGDAELAGDATQETFFRLFRYTDFSAFKAPEQFLAYLVTVTRHAAADLRRKAWEFRLVQEPGSTRSDESARLILEQVIDNLDEPDRRLAELLNRGHTLSEIARTLKISYSAAGVRVFRLRQRLRNILIS